METRNITLSLPEDVLREAEVMAVPRGTSVSALLAGALSELVERESGYAAAKERSLATLGRGLHLGTGGEDEQACRRLRPGTYVFYDRMQAHLGACSLDECAATVVCTVVSRPSEDLAVIDGGSKTFATDVPPGSEPLNLKGFGHVIGYPGVVLERLTEEHGMLALDRDCDLEVGDTLQIIPNHICSTVNLHDEVNVVDNDGAVEKVRVAARGKVR